MTSLPQPMLASYWIPAVGIAPQTRIVFVGYGNFSCTPANFQPPYISIAPGVLQQLTLQPGQTQTNVQQLQAAGIKVLLSVSGTRATQMGWDTIPYGQGPNKYADMIAFAKWVQTNLIDAYGLDGIDIDDEWAPTDPQAFMDTVGTLRNFMSGSLLTKALWDDDAHFQTAVSSDAPYNGGAMLSSLLDLGCTMAYGYSFSGQVQAIATYQGYGMTWNQLCVGVQAGTGQWMTPIAEVTQLAQWAVTPQSGSPPVLGIMLYTFSQDIQQWTHAPPNSPGYMYPNANDHAWQQAIVDGMWGPGNWIVNG